MENSFIKIYRGLLDWEWYNDSKMVHLFLHLLLKANFVDGRFQGHEVKRGQLIVGLNSLSKDTSITPQSLRTCINKLKSTGEITTKSTNRYTVVTVVKYNEYQSFEKQLTNKSTNKQHSTNKQLTTIEEGKNDKKEIILFLNQKLQSSFKETEKTFNFIEARLNQNFTLADFKLVIENQTKEWIDNPKMKKYLRPETLFGNKFEGYLQTAKIKNQRTQQTQLINSVSERDALFGDR